MSTATRRARTRGGKADDFGPPSKADTARARRAAKASDDMLDDIYKMGVKEGRRTSSGSKKRRRSSSRRRRGPAAPTRRSMKAGAKAVVGPAAANIGSGMQLVGATFGLLLLYLALTSSNEVAGVFGAIRRGLDWLTNPSASIPFRN